MDSPKSSSSSSNSTSSSVLNDKEDQLLRPATINTSTIQSADRESTPLMSPLPLTPRRPSFPSKLSLQMPSRGPLSPVLDPALGYSVARRPRLDFARACTSLHHSTLAEASPDSSPLALGSCPIPRNGKPLESPIGPSSHPYQASSHASSLGSQSMLDYAPSGDDGDSSSDEDSLDLDMGPPSTTQNEAAISLSLLNTQKARLGTRGIRKHSTASSNSGHSSLTSPPPPPPPVTPPIPSTPVAEGTSRPNGFTGPGNDSRRRRLSLPGRDDRERPDPVKRPVSRRGSLLPKTKNFQRIRAALIEESSPIDEEVKREAEVTRQIREDDGEEPAPMPLASPCNYSLPEPVFDIDVEGRVDGNGDGKDDKEGMSFSKQAQRHGSFWFGDQMEGINGSPPAFPGSRHGSDGDIRMNSESVSSSPASSVPPEIRRVKRRRTQDERFEPSAFKRRAVSPGLSHSPILASSPQSTAKKSMNISFQGMNDTNEGLMKMTL